MENKKRNNFKMKNHRKRGKLTLRICVYCTRKKIVRKKCSSIKKEDK